MPRDTLNAILAAHNNTPRKCLQKAQVALGPKLAAYSDAIYLDPRLFARVKALNDRAAAPKLNPEQAMLLDVYYQRFIRAGAQLSAADQATCAISTSGSPRWA
nr:hypothetical protein [Sphingomonas bacterium]